MYVTTSVVYLLTTRLCSLILRSVSLVTSIALTAPYFEMKVMHALLVYKDLARLVGFITPTALSSDCIGLAISTCFNGQGQS